MSRSTEYAPPIISERLTIALEESGLSCNAVAQRVGVNRKTVYGWRDGASCPYPRQLYRLEAVLGKPKGWLQGLMEEAR